MSVTRQVFPVLTYSNVVLLVPVFLVTDLLRYKPVIVLQGLTYVATFLLLLVGSGVHSAQLALFIYSIAMAADVAYFSYIYTVVHASYYQRVTSYVRAAILLGYAVGGLLAQLLVSLGGVSLYCLAVITLISVSAALITTFFLPMPKTSLFLHGAYPAQQGSPPDEGGAHDSESQDFWVKSAAAAEHVGRMLTSVLVDCKKCYSSAALLFFCIWAATGRCGFYQVTGYVQLLWVHIQPHNFTAYNGGVDAIGTLSGAAATVAVGHVSLEWSVWAELILGGFTLLIAGALFLMDLTDNIWISYACCVLFKTLYMQLATVCTFQIAKALNRRRYALVFGVNSFAGAVLQSVLTAVVINTRSLQLTITSQFFIYASYFAALSLLFTVRAEHPRAYLSRWYSPCPDVKGRD
ncbi:putative thiamine transporter 2-like [Scophthalmus maximus]|uniref:Putative thiamine transporter 2-like n=1 Tax=Scophthalmus maximus TaxID=52904 RepID=A0A2U9C1U4_SCOMX|nr:putative thiamine transporter 2-like [Scophthalmus maximus]